jgi:hypothetical protein
MPASPTPPITSIFGAEPSTAHGCAFASACVSASLAIPSFSNTSNYIELPSTEAASTFSSRLPATSPAPPFHPPKA